MMLLTDPVSCNATSLIFIRILVSLKEKQTNKQIFQMKTIKLALAYIEGNCLDETEQVGAPSVC